MANAHNNSVVQLNKEAMVDEWNMLVGDFMTPKITQSQLSVDCPPFEQSNFQLNTLFQNGHQFYGRDDENPHIHVS